MTESVIITNEAFEKGKGVFLDRGNALSWNRCGDTEDEAAAAVRKHRARIAVLGTAAYRGALYAALARNAGGNPALIARFGVGYDGIDLEQCRGNRIILTITRGALDQSVAEHAVALLLSIAREIPRMDREMRAGAYLPVTGSQLANKAVGVAGFGKIGRSFARIASLGFGMRIHAFDSVPVEEQAARENLDVGDFLERHRIESYHSEFGPFAQSVRIISIHMPVSAETRCFFSRERLLMIAKDTLLINTSRGALIDETALHAALASGRLRAAALDVYENEPYRPASPAVDLRTLPNVVLTPHVASNTVEANQGMARMVMESIEGYVSGNYDLLPRVV